jgi:hypothetical protein
MSPVKRRAPGTLELLLTEAYLALGGPKRVAKLIKKGESQTAAYADPDLRHSIKGCDLVTIAIALPPPCKGLIAEFFAELAGGFFTPGEASEESLAELFAVEATEHGKVSAGIARALERHGPRLATAQRTALRVEVAREQTALAAMSRKLAEVGEA